MLKWFKKGQLGLQTLQPIVLTLVVVSIVTVVGFNILASLQSTQTPGSAAANAAGNMSTALSTNLVNNFGIIVLIAVFAVILSLVAYFAARR